MNEHDPQSSAPAGFSQRSITMLPKDGSMAIAIAHEVTERESFNITIAYDKAQSGRRAMGLLDGIVAQCGGRFAIRHEVWRFDVLELPEIHKMASASVVKADLIVLAADGEHDLPPWVKGWLKTWSEASNPGYGALAAMLRGRPESIRGRSPARCFLETLAHATGKQFFAREAGAPSRMEGLSVDKTREPDHRPPAGPHATKGQDPAEPGYGSFLPPRT